MEEKQALTESVYIKEPSVTDGIDFIDGVSLPVKCGSNVLSQATKYHHDRTICNNVFCLAPAGKIIFIFINYTES